MGNFAIKVDGEVVWESEEESDLITGVHVSGPGGEWGHAGSPVGDSSINITFDKRSTIDSSHLDLVEREVADARRTRQEEESKDAVAKGRKMMEESEKVDEPVLTGNEPAAVAEKRSGETELTGSLAGSELNDDTENNEEEEIPKPVRASRAKTPPKDEVPEF